MSMGYASVQGFTGDPRNPIAPEFDFDALLGPISKGLGVASGLVGAIGKFSEAKALKGQASQFRRMAKQAWRQGVDTGIDISHAGLETTGTMMATFGKSGTLLEGSPLLALADTTREIELNVARAIEQGRIEKEALLAEARQAERAARGAKMAGIAGLVGIAAGPAAGFVTSLVLK